MRTSTQVNVTETIDNSGIGTFQIGLFVLCALCLIMDGFDVQAVGYVGPALIREWHITARELGQVAAAGNFGVLIGAVVFTMVADKIGRRPVVIAATFYFSILTFAAARAASLQELLTLRFIAGIGLGCIIPNATALIGEYSPSRKRATLMMTVSVAFTAGAAIGGLASAWLIPTYGWRVVFYVGGAMPLVIALLMTVWLPESLQFLVLRGGNMTRVANWLKRINPSTPTGSEIRYVVDEENKGGVPVVHLFREGRGVATTMFWIVNFMNLLNLYFLSSFLATVFTNAGYSGPAALMVPTTLQTGGTLGVFVLAWLVTRSGFTPVLTGAFAIACVMIALIGQPGLPVPVLFIVVFLAGWCVVGGQPVLNTLAATYYPTYLRSTGIGWGLGVGRLGAIVGPYVGGEFLTRHWTTQHIFLAAAIPAFISAALMFSLRAIAGRGRGI
jgi:AAHS family 4-hydroxybenzoate transporter-like MFS transporter